MNKKEMLIVNKLKILTETIKAETDGDNEESFKIKNKNECCINTCSLLNTYLKTKTDRLTFINKQIEVINNTSESYRTDIIETWIGRANSEAKKLKNQVSFKIDEVNKIKKKIPCKCE